MATPWTNTRTRSDAGSGDVSSAPWSRSLSAVLNVQISVVIVVIGCVDHDGWKYNVNALDHATDAEASNATRPVAINSTGP
jgi:hypothetical protein